MKNDFHIRLWYFFIAVMQIVFLNVFVMYFLQLLHLHINVVFAFIV